MSTRSSERRCTVLLVAVYAVLAVSVVTEKWGQTTNDTRLELTEDPGGYLASTFSLWHPATSLGELQNQAYGYLFPQGAFFAVWHAIGVPGWVTQRAWSVLVLLVACEGVRRLARALGNGPWPAAVAGLVYGLTPRVVVELGLRSAEMLPTAVLPWAVLPLIHVMTGRRRPRDGAILSAAALAFAGGVNGTVTAAPIALLVVLVVWAWRRRLVTWRFAAGWMALVAAVNAWWAVSLLRLGAYSPPFFDYVEDARTTTSAAGFAQSLRGNSNWVSSLQVGGSPWWPAGYQLSTSPWLVLGSALVAAMGFVGLLRMRGRFRTPLLLAALLGLLCQVVAHTTGHGLALDGPLAQPLQDLLDGALAPLRNVSKADPIVRVPLALGCGVLVEDLIRAWGGARLRRIGVAGLTLALAGGLVAMAGPVLGANLRTPGWDRVPAYWSQAADYVAQRPGATWVIPGSGFGIESWGWTMEEPMIAVGHSPWVSRTQIPLTPPGTIRVLSRLESYLETGSGSPYLRFMLARLGITQVLLRHDLDADVAQVPPSSLVSVALARSPGITRSQTFGGLAFGPAVEVFHVAPVPGGAPASQHGYDVRDSAGAVTVASASDDAVAAVGDGLVAPDQPMVVAGAPGWDRPADVVGDGLRRRERDFGRIHDADSDVMTADEPDHTRRVLENYPGPPGAQPVVARYLGIAGVIASSSRGWASTLGQVRPEDAPWSALDGDASTYWEPAPFQPAVGQWIDVDLGRPRPIGEITLAEPVGVLGLDRAGSWRVTAGATTRTLTPDPFTGRGTIDLGGVQADHVRVSIASAPSSDATIGLAELGIAGVQAQRTLVVPPVRVSDRPAYVFSAVPEARACVTTLLGPDCDPGRQRASEEAAGIDRTFTTSSASRFRLRALVVARSDTATDVLLRPLHGVTMTASSWYAADPTVSPRMAYDGDAGTEWIADPRDPHPTLHVDLGRPRSIRRLTVGAPSGVAATPGSVRLVTPDGQRRTVDLHGFGSFAPVRTRHLTLRFERAPGTSSQHPLGLSELQLEGGHAVVPLDGAAPTGSVCGYGPTLVVDGHRSPTRVSGELGAVTAAGQLAVHPCGGVKRWSLAPGVHRVRLLSTRQFQPVRLSLLPTAAPQVDGAAGRSRSLQVRSVHDNRVVLDVGDGQDAILSAPFNINTGWRATIDGRALAPIEVDGWAQGWRLPRGTSGRVTLAFTPQGGYVAGLVVGLVLIALVLLAAAWVLVRGRLCAPVPVPVAVPRRHARRRVPRPVLVLTAAGVGWLLGGPVVGAAAAAGVLLASRPRLAQVAVAAILVGAAVATAIALGDGPGRPATAVDLVTGAALAVGFAAAFVRRTDP